MEGSLLPEVGHIGGVGWAVINEIEVKKSETKIEEDSETLMISDWPQWVTR